MFFFTSENSDFDEIWQNVVGALHLYDFSLKFEQLWGFHSQIYNIKKFDGFRRFNKNRDHHFTKTLYC